MVPGLSSVLHATQPRTKCALLQVLDCTYNIYTRIQRHAPKIQGDHLRPTHIDLITILHTLAAAEVPAERGAGLVASHLYPAGTEHIMDCGRGRGGICGACWPWWPMACRASVQPGVITCSGSAVLVTLSLSMGHGTLQCCHACEWCPGRWLGIRQSSARDSGSCYHRVS